MGNATDAQVTGVDRPLLLRIDAARSAAEWNEQVAAAARAGFDGVELAIAGPAAQGLPLDDHTPVTKVGAAAVRSAWLDADAAIEQLAAFLRRVAPWGVTCTNVALPPLQAADDGPGFARYQDGLNFAYRFLHGIRYDAEATGVTVAIEAAHGGCLLSPVELREIIDEANSWAVGACLDIDGIRRIGSPEDWITTLGRRVLAVRARVDDTSSADRVRIRLAPLRTTIDTAGGSASLIAVGPLA